MPYPIPRSPSGAPQTYLSGLDQYLFGPPGSAARFPSPQAAVDQSRLDGFVTSDNPALIVGLPGTYDGGLNVIGPGFVMAGISGMSGDARWGPPVIRGLTTINLGLNPDIASGSNGLTFTNIQFAHLAGDPAGPVVDVLGEGIDLISFAGGSGVLTQDEDEIAIRSLKTAGITGLLTSPDVLIQSNKGVALDLTSDVGGFQFVKLEGPLRALQAGESALLGARSLVELRGDVTGRIEVIGGTLLVENTTVRASGVPNMTISAGAVATLLNCAVDGTETPLFTGAGELKFGPTPLVGAGSGVAGTLTKTALALLA